MQELNLAKKRRIGVHELNEADDRDELTMISESGGKLLWAEHEKTWAALEFLEGVDPGSYLHCVEDNIQARP